LFRAQAQPSYIEGNPKPNHEISEEEVCHRTRLQGHIGADASDLGRRQSHADPEPGQDDV
jgi:hypothetical protein